jgi:hypothetical protein
MPTTRNKKSTLTKEQELMWTILQGSYGDKAWEMLEDMKGKKFSHKKASKHLAYIMDNWPDEEVCRTLRTWMLHSNLDTDKINTFISTQFHEKYRDFVRESRPFQTWPKPTKS